MLNPDGGRFVGVDLEARNLMAMVVDFSQRPLHHVHEKIHPADSAAQILVKIEQAIDECLAGDPRPVLGIGMGVPGTIDPEAGVAVCYDLIPGWKDVALGERLGSRYGVPVFLENNIRSLAMAELWFGGGRGQQNFACVGIRSGVATGMVMDGRLVHGTQHRAGEIGHWFCPVPSPLSDEAALAPSRPWQSSRAATGTRGLGAGAGGRRTAPRRAGRKDFAGRHRGRVDHRRLDGGRTGRRCFRPVAGTGRGPRPWLGGAPARRGVRPGTDMFAGPLADLGEPFLATVRDTACLEGARRADHHLVHFGRCGGAVGAAALALDQWKPKR